MLAEPPAEPIYTGRWIKLGGMRGLFHVREAAGYEYNHYIFHVHRYVGGAVSDCYIAAPPTAVTPTAAQRYHFETRPRKLKLDRGLWKMTKMTLPRIGHFQAIWK